jgi:PHP family Zn ribbon phosphoesterase
MFSSRYYADLHIHSQMNGLRAQDPETCGGTVDLFPEEGKYHHDGHRVCRVRLSPEESTALNNLCPVCGKPVTIGVLHRVLELERKQGPAAPPAQTRRLPHRHIVPLPELLSQRLGAAPSSKKVETAYRRALTQAGPELPLLLDAPRTTLEALGGLGEAIQRVRDGRVTRESGFDGEYGVIRVL